MVQNKARTKSQSRMEQEKVLKELEALKAKRQVRKDGTRMYFHDSLR